MVESLASYITRLASAHCVTPGSLFARMIGPITSARQRARSAISQVRAPELAMNSCGEIPELIVNAVQTLTCHSNLRLLTLLDWRGALSRHNLARPTQAWCPCCYEEWRTSGAPLFQPLIWSIAAITVCDRHQKALRMHCPGCNRAIGPVGIYYRPGCCTKCGAWLGEPSEPRANDLIASPQKAIRQSDICQLKDLLATTTNRFYDGQIGDDLRNLVKSSRWRSCASFAHAAGIMPARLFQLFESRCRPSLAQLLAICSTAETSLKDFLSGRLNFVVNSNAIKDRGPRPRCPDEWTRHRLREKTSVALAAALIQYPPISIERVAFGLQVSASYVEQKFPKEAAELKAKLKQYRRERMSRIEVILKDALASSNPPSIATLASQAGFSPGYIRECSPEVYKKLCDLRRAVKPQAVIKRKQKLSDQIRCAALALHRRGEYPSLGNIRRELV